ncbi:MAG: glycosyltransferase family 4 protein [candidate division KSB1 bacterium]|nr:glycosyltransferase family 4 protein [candidate division KSB1 bacterium]
MSGADVRGKADGAPRVVMVNWVYSPEHGGGARQCQLLVRQLLQRGVQVEVIARTRTRALLGTSIVDGVVVRRVPDENGRPGSRVRTAMALMAELYRCAWAEIVHTHGFMPEVAVAARTMGKRLVQKVTLVGLDDATSLQRRRLGSFALRLAKTADAVVGPSQAAIVQSLAAGVPAQKLWAIPNGVDLRRFRPASIREKKELRQALHLDAGAFLVAFVGSSERRKGLDLAMSAVAMARKKGLRSAQLVVLGPKPYDASQPGFDEHARTDLHGKAFHRAVHFVGLTADVPEYLRAADLFVLPSRAEGQPNALLEAMACGLPCVARRLDGVTDELLLNGRRGRLVDGDEAEDFARALLELAESPQTRKTLGAEARAYVERHHDIGRVADAYCALYGTLLRR